MVLHLSYLVITRETHQATTGELIDVLGAVLTCKDQTLTGMVREKLIALAIPKVSKVCLLVFLVALSLALVVHQ